MGKGSQLIYFASCITSSRTSFCTRLTNLIVAIDAFPHFIRKTHKNDVHDDALQDVK